MKKFKVAPYIFNIFEPLSFNGVKEPSVYHLVTIIWYHLKE